jgi:hypothetical protein
MEKTKNVLFVVVSLLLIVSLTLTIKDRVKNDCTCNA